MEDRVKNVMASVFEVDSKSINEITSSDSIDSWDSLKHINLVVALEEEFDITFDDEEILELVTYKLILHMVGEKISSKAER